MDCLMNPRKTQITLNACLCTCHFFLLDSSLLNVNTSINALKFPSLWGFPSVPLSAIVSSLIFKISTELLVYCRCSPAVAMPFEVRLLKCVIQRHLQHCWGAIQVLSAEKLAGQTVDFFFFTIEWVMECWRFGLQWGLTVLCNVGSNFCDLSLKAAFHCENGYKLRNKTQD